MKGGTVISIFELFSIGIGPSSSHTVGPMRAANHFIKQLANQSFHRIIVELYGSLALTGQGHGTDRAVLLGLEGHEPETVEPQFVYHRSLKIKQAQEICINNQPIRFDYQHDMLFYKQKHLPYHSNAMCFSVLDHHNHVLLREVYYSIGGGFIISESELQSPSILHQKTELPYYYETAKKLLEYCELHDYSIADVVLENEKHWLSEKEVKDKLDKIWQVMNSAIENGCLGKGLLPGDLKVRRRAPIHYRALTESHKNYPQKELNWLNVYAMAVNEENAAGHRIVTAPTNGAAGIIPAVLKYYLTFYPDAKSEDVYTYLLTAGGIAVLYKKQASISGAEVGCQGEVGVACSMAAGALAAVLGGTVEQVENAAEIGMEHHLGLTCDPILGLVQVPCIERNAMAATHAVSAAHLAIIEDGTHLVSLDQVIQTMKQTGEDMHRKYKETAEGGLAVSVPVC